MPTIPRQLPLFPNLAAETSVQRTIHYLGSKLRLLDPIRHAVAAVAPVGEPREHRPIDAQRRTGSLRHWNQLTRWHHGFRLQDVGTPARIRRARWPRSSPIAIESPQHAGLESAVNTDRSHGKRESHNIRRQHGPQPWEKGIFPRIPNTVVDVPHGGEIADSQRHIKQLDRISDRVEQPTVCRVRNRLDPGDASNLRRSHIGGTPSIRPGRTGEEDGLEPVVEAAGGLGLFQGVDEFRQRSVVDPAPALGRGDGQTDREVRLADAGRAEEDDVLLPLQEPEFVERVHLLPLDRGLEAEVEVRERLDRRKPARPHGRGQASAVAQRDLGGQESRSMASAAVVPPLSTPASTSSKASRAPGIFRSASWAAMRALRDRDFTRSLP